MEAFAEEMSTTNLSWQMQNVLFPSSYLTLASRSCLKDEQLSSFDQREEKWSLFTSVFNSFM
jgi:hypothetical protein